MEMRKQKPELVLYREKPRIREPIVERIIYPPICMHDPRDWRPEKKKGNL